MLLLAGVGEWLVDCQRGTDLVISAHQRGRIVEVILTHPLYAIIGDSCSHQIAL